MRCDAKTRVFVHFRVCARSYTRPDRTPQGIRRSLNGYVGDRRATVMIENDIYTCAAHKSVPRQRGLTVSPDNAQCGNGDRLRFGAGPRECSAVSTGCGRRSAPHALRLRTTVDTIGLGLVVL